MSQGNLRDIPVKFHTCPRCGGPLDTVLATPGAPAPPVGAYTVCAHCARPLRVIEGGGRAAVDDDELARLGDEQPELRAHLATLCAMVEAADTEARRLYRAAALYRAAQRN